MLRFMQIHISKVVVDGVSRTKDDLIKDVFTQFFNIHTCEEVSPLIAVSE